MVFAGERYYNINRIILSIIGLWPYQKPMLLHNAFVLGAFVFSTVFQCTPFLTRTYNIEYIVKQLSFILPNIMYLSYYNIIYFNGSVMKQLFEEIKADWNVAVESFEVQILEKYAFYNCLVSIMLFCSIIFSVTLVASVELVPILLDVLAPLNQSRPRKLKIDFELFVDEQQYFYIYLIFEIVVTAVAFLTLIGTGTLLISYLVHCCARYKIASTLLENIVTTDTSRIPAHEKGHVMHLKICRAVHIHRKFLKVLMSTLNNWFFIIMVVCVLSLSCNLLRLIDVATSLKELSELIMCLFIVHVHFFIMFISNLIGQFVTNHSAEMFHAVYRTMWYLAPLPIQKLLLFVMQHSLKADTLMIGGIFVASLEGFSTLITTALSYFTVMHNVI